ncbi:MAG: OmpA family protein [Deltaproteobacteria bacterium]|nr:OmpA family protein [Deltaproteobacteria bacterium]
MRWLRVAAMAALCSFVGLSRAGATPTESGETGLTLIPTTDVLEPWSPSAGVHLNGPAGDSNGSSALGLWRTSFTLGVGLLPNLELTSQIPYIQFERDDPTRRHTDDLGGIRVGGKYRLFNEADDAPVSFALMGSVVLGTGRDGFPAILDRGSGAGRRETYEVMAVLDKVLWQNEVGDPLRLTLNAGGLFFDHPRSFSRKNQSLQFQRRFTGSVATFSIPFEFATGLQVPVWSSDNFVIQLLEEFRGNTGTVNEVHGSLPTWLFSGVRLGATTGLGLQAGVDFGLSGYLEPYRFLSSLSYSMPNAEAHSEPVADHAVETAENAPPAPLLPTRKKLVLRGINFDYDKSAIRPDSMVILREAADTLKENPDISVIVEGHTDSKGTAEYNQRLSARRAVAVRDQLERMGVTGLRMVVRGRGETQPIASNETEAGRAENRRVELLAH